MPGKVSDDRDSCENEFNYGNHGDYNVPEDEDSVTNDRDSGHFSDGAENCDLKQLNTSPDLSQCDGEIFSASDCFLESSNEKKKFGKRKYYMWGSHKLLKPIKDIPMRFQILLAESNSERLRCEGQPIYMQHSTGPQEHWDHNLVFSETDNSHLQNLDQCATNIEVSGSLNNDVPLCHESYYSSNTTSNDVINHGGSVIHQNSVPIYEMSQCAEIHNKPNVFVVYVPHSVNAHIFQTEPVNCAVHMVTAPSVCQPSKILPAQQVDQINSTSYLIPTVNQTSSCPTQPVIAPPGDPKLAQNYHTVTTDQLPIQQNNPLKYESSNQQHNQPTSYLTPHFVIPSTYSKYTNNQNGINFSHLSTPPPNFPYSHMIGPFSQPPPTTLSQNYSPVLIGVPYNGWIVQAPPYLDSSYQ